MNEYEAQAQKFLKDTNTELTIKFLKFDKYFSDDTHARLVWEVTLNRNERLYTFNFGDSLANTEKALNYGKVKSTRINYPEKVMRDKMLLNDYKKLMLAYIDRDKIKKPTAYDILACLDVSYFDDFDDFCSMYGYDTDSRNAEKIFNAIKEQNLNLQVLFSDSELEQLNEIA